MKSLTITGTSVVLNFDSTEGRDKALASFASNTPREIHGRARSGFSDGGENGEDTHTLTVRLQDITHPVTIALNGKSAVAPANMSATTGLPTHLSRFTGKDAADVPGPNAEARVNERETTSGVNLMRDTPGAVNNDPSTASNAGYEGSPAQAIQSAAGNGPNTPTPGGFVGPDKAAEIRGAAPGTTVPAVSAEKLHPEGSDKQDQGAVKVQRESDKQAAEGEKARVEAAKPAASAPATPAKPASAPAPAPAPAKPATVPTTAPKTVTPAKEAAPRTAGAESAPNSGKTESEASAKGVDR